MHSYSIDTDVRRTVFLVLATVALAIPTAFEAVRSLCDIPPTYGFPLTFGTLLGGLYFAFDRWIWRWPGVRHVVGIPVVAGRWEARGISSYKGPDGEPFRYTMEIVVRQTFSKMEVFTETKDSTSRSTLGGFCVEHARPVFRYAFENTPNNMANPELQRHPGLIELRINSEDEMAGDYFSGKHRLRYGELALVRKKEK